MPCRCCGASRPSKGFKEDGESKINDLLKEASRLILEKNVPDDYGDSESDWKQGWKEAFDHHLNGCNE